jgi:hypothetical protein
MNVQIKLSVYRYFKEGQYIGYCPALEVMTFSDNENEILPLIKESIDSFFEYHGYINNALRSLGWVFIGDIPIPPLFQKRSFYQLIGTIDISVNVL